jgi:uncharacterized alpha/beta hydrolase family protein
MKITKKVFEQMIREEFQRRLPSEAKENDVMPNFTDYEAEDLSSDEQMIILLKDIVAQLKVLNYAMTPAKTVGASAGEKARASYTVSESEDK